MNDEAKTYKVFYRAPSCLGKYCWRQEDLYGGRVIARGMLVNGKLSYNLSKPSKNKIYIVETNGEELVFTKVIVKNNKYGKDGEFGDKLDNYKFLGTVEPEEQVKKWQEEYRQKLAEMRSK